MSEFEDLVLEYEGGFPGSGPNWAAYEKMKARGRYLEEENARLREAQRWIPVSERLPEKPGKCEAYIPRLDELPFDFVDFGIGFEGHKFFLHGMDITEFVTHWRPIPQPPEVE